MRWLFTFLGFVMYCSIKCVAQVFVNPVFDRTDAPSFRVEKVEIASDTTYVYCQYHADDNSWANISSDTYLEDLNTKRKYQIVKSVGLPFGPDFRTFNIGGVFQFVFCFPHIDNLQKFNLIEDSQKSAFNIYGIDLSTSSTYVYTENEYIRFKNMSDFYQSANDCAKYIDYEEKELAAAQYVFGIKSMAASMCYHYLSGTYNELGDYTKAIDLGLKAAECDSVYLGVCNKENPVYVITLSNLSNFYLNAGKEYEALQCVQKCLEIKRNIGDENGYINELHNLLLTGENKEGIIKRISIAKQELDTLPDFIDSTSIFIAGIMKRIALNYELINDNYNAIEYCNKALSILDYSEQTTSEQYAELLGLKCKYQQRSKQADEAIVSGEAAKQLFESLEIKSLKYAELLGDLALAYGLVFHFEKSIQLFKIAADIYENAKEWLLLAGIYNSISDHYKDAEDLSNAEQYVRKAIDVLYSHDNVEQYSGWEKNASIIQFTINTEKLTANGALAMIYYKQERFKEAIETERENGNVLIKMGDSQMYVSHLSQLSLYYLKNKQFTEAIDCAEQSIMIDNRAEVLADAKLSLSLAYLFIGEENKATQYANEAMNILDTLSNKESKINAQYILSVLYLKTHDYEKSEKYLSDALEYLKITICNDVIGMTMKQKQRMWNKYEKYFLLYRNIVEQSDRKVHIISKLYDYVLFSKSLLLDTEISNNSHIKISWQDIQQQLLDDDIAIEFIATTEETEGNYYTYHALIMDKTCSYPCMITLYSESDLEKMRKTDNRDIRDIVGEFIWKPIIEQYSQAKNIYFSPDGLIHLLPIEYYNIENGEGIFERHNIYRLSSTKELIRKHNSQQSNNAVLYGGLNYDELKEFTSNESTGEMSSIMRGIEKRGGFDPLYNTLTEIQEIKELLTKNNIASTIYTGENGTEESFRNLSKQCINMIHLATHGMYVSPENVAVKKQENNFDFLEILMNENDPVKEDVALTHCFLVMAGGNKLVQRYNVSDRENDGILTAKEISQLDFHNLDLVVLSACESALGELKTGGVYGLQRGFKKAGANTILMSLDKVDDEATKILMVEFYKNLMSGKSKHQSLKDAQKHLREIDNGKFNKPEYWASFILLDGLN